MEPVNHRNSALGYGRNYIHCENETWRHNDKPNLPAELALEARIVENVKCET